MAMRKFTRWVLDLLSGLGMFTQKETTVFGPAPEIPEIASQKNNGALSSYISGPTVVNDFPMSPFWGASNPGFPPPAPCDTPSHPPAS